MYEKKGKEKMSDAFCNNAGFRKALTQHFDCCSQITIGTVVVAGELSSG